SPVGSAWSGESWTAGPQTSTGRLFALRHRIDTRRLEAGRYRVLRGPGGSHGGGWGHGIGWRGAVKVRGRGDLLDPLSRLQGFADRRPGGARASRRRRPLG